jgi:uncharacterized protein YceK
MKKKLLVAIPLASAILFSGCATILSGKTQKINVTSYPSHQKVTIGSQTVVTPAIVAVDRDNKDLIVKAKNCDAQRLEQAQINPVFFVNILSAGAFGSTTDYATGAMWKYDDNIHIDCEK